MAHLFRRLVAYQARPPPAAGSKSRDARLNNLKCPEEKPALEGTNE